jgi:hypothetical protein
MLGVENDQALNGSGTAESVTGITNASSGVASIALSTDARWVNLLKGIEAVRISDFTGPVDLVAHPAALSLLLREVASGTPTFRREVLDALVSVVGGRLEVVGPRARNRGLGGLGGQLGGQSDPPTDRRRL